MNKIDENSKEEINERQRIMFERENMRLNKIYEDEYNSPFKKMERKNIYKRHYEMNKNTSNLPDNFDFEEWYKNNEPSYTPREFLSGLKGNTK
jgi:hypothetical protein